MGSAHTIASLTHRKALLFMGIDCGCDGSTVSEDIVMTARSVGSDSKIRPYGPFMSVEALKVTMASVQVSSDGLSTVAFVTPSSIDSEALLTRLGNRLTQYLIPSAIFSVGHKVIAAGQEDFIRVAQSTKNGQLPQKKQSQSSIVEKSTQLRDFRPSTKVQNTSALRVARIWQDPLALQ